MPIAEDPEPRPAAEDDPFDGLVLDDDFVRGASVKEPSGRARMLTEKWKRQPPEAEPWRPVTEIRRSRFGRRARRLDAWGNPVRRRRRNWQAPVFVLLAVAVTAAALNIDKLRDWYHHDDTPVSSALPSVGPETARPTTAAPSVAPDVPTAEHPWAGSPAEAWPEGADALVLPEAQAVGVFGKDEVAEQLKNVKAFLVAANIDPATLHGGTPEAALSLLDRKDRDMVEEYLAHPSDENDPTSWISRFNPKLAVPVTDRVKVQGRITFESDGDKGVLVHTDVSYVYALRPGPEVGKQQSAPSAAPSTGGSGGGGDTKPVSLREGTTATVEREIVRRQQDFRFYDPARYQVKRGKLVLGHGFSDFANNVCAMGSGYLETDFPTSVPTGSPQPKDGSTTDPYDRSKSLEQHDGCGTITRS
ncbi:hypothetical protein [Kitasatospora terrestris]|uniref:Uncharacterized protein n=1 Tax=Kitasatospora terrestris TaxID=258051 RepID=A0ABP9DNB6_9ACTN